MSPLIYAGLSNRQRNIFLNGRFLTEEKLIVKAVLKEMKVDMEAVTSTRKNGNLPETRQIIAGLLKEHTELTLINIAALLGRVNHTSIIYAVRTFKNRIETEPAFREKIQRIKNNLK